MEFVHILLGGNEVADSMAKSGINRLQLVVGPFCNLLILCVCLLYLSFCFILSSCLIKVPFTNQKDTNKGKKKHSLTLIRVCRPWIHHANSAPIQLHLRARIWTDLRPSKVYLTWSVGYHFLHNGRSWVAERPWVDQTIQTPLPAMIIVMLPGGMHRPCSGIGAPFLQMAISRMRTYVCMYLFINFPVIGMMMITKSFYWMVVIILVRELLVVLLWMCC